MSSGDLKWLDYVVFGLTLFLSSAIGIYFGLFGSKQKTTQEYLMANREMGAFPVAISLVCSFVSAISLIANPAEIYLYGMIALTGFASYLPMAFTLQYIFLPVYFKMQIKSVYEYLEHRFNYKIRWTVSIVAALKDLFGMAIAVFATSLVLNAVTSMSPRLFAAILFGVCIFYSTLGGLRGVLWTDVLQGGLVFICLFSICLVGIVDVGGFRNLWETADRMGRLRSKVALEFNPRVRHTLWTGLIAQYFINIASFATSQMSVQRFLALPSKSKVTKTLAINLIALMLTQFLCSFVGLLILVKYAHCDPISNEEVRSSDQLVPHFVKNLIHEYNIPGLLGLFIAGLVAATLSSVSSALTALSSIVAFDQVNNFWPNLQDPTLMKISKISCLLLGIASFGFTFVMESLGAVIEIMTSVLAITTGPVLAVFSLGLFFPWANAKGAMLGLVLSVGLMTAYITGNRIMAAHGMLPDQRLPLNTDQCQNATHATVLINEDSVKEDGDDDSFIATMLSVSYLWYNTMSTMLTLILGLLFSLFINIWTRPNSQSKSDRIPKSYFSLPVLKIWEFIFPKSHLQNFYFDDSNEDNSEFK